MSQQLLQAPMSGVYFKASSEIETLDEFEGKKGMFIKTFALNDKRNKNGWRAIWEGTKKNIHTFKGRPGIVFEKCDADGCDLDHTEAQTEEMSLQVQEPFRKTTIVGWPMNESTHTAYFVHETKDAEFFKDVKAGKYKYVSPSIWPKAGGFEIVGTREDGQPLIDVWEWTGLHDAFVNRPAFGDDAKVTATCEGANCPVKLLSAKEATAYAAADKIQECVTKKIEKHGEEPTKQKLAIFYSECRKELSGIVDQGDIPHLQQVPLLINHNKKKRFISVSPKAYKAVENLLKDGSGVDESKVFEIIRQEQENSSFNSCTCKANRMPEISEKEHEELKSKLKATEEEKKELESKAAKAQEEEEKKMEARKARLVAQLKSQTEEEREKTAAAIRASEDEEEMKALDEAEKEVKTASKGKSGQENEEKKEQDAKIAKLEATISEPLIAKMAEARALKGVSEEEVEAFKKSYEGKPLAAVEADYAKEKIFIEETLSANEQQAGPELKSFPMMGSTQTALSGKSLEEILDGVNN